MRIASSKIEAACLSAGHTFLLVKLLQNGLDPEPSAQTWPCGSLALHGQLPQRLKVRRLHPPSPASESIHQVISQHVCYGRPSNNFIALHVVYSGCLVDEHYQTGQLLHPSPDCKTSCDAAHRVNNSLTRPCWRLSCELQWLFVVIRELLARPECSEERWFVLAKHAVNTQKETQSAHLVHATLSFEPGSLAALHNRPGG